MSDGLAKAVYEALLPPGSLWQPKPGGGLDLLLEAMGESDGDVIELLDSLSSLRNPFKTSILSDLEKEYGIVPSATATEDQRRMALATIIYQDRSTGSAEELETALQNNGFDVQVHENSPAVDPDTFLNSVFLMYADGPNAFAGFIPLSGPPSTAIAGKTGGYLLVNGFSGTQRPEYISFAGAATMVANNGDALAGRFDSLVIDELFYPVSDDPDTWPLYFFVGGDTKRRGQESVETSNGVNVETSNGVNVETSEGDNALLTIETAEVPSSRKEEFERLILRYKPMHTWAGLIVNYT
jgi:hypothetical protein